MSHERDIVVDALRRLGIAASEDDIETLVESRPRWAAVVALLRAANIAQDEAPATSFRARRGGDVTSELPAP
jgi:hypothetical protein